MSAARTPVVIVTLPNQPFLLICFDTTKFSPWYRSAPFPEDIEYIRKGFHVFGRSHLAIAKRTDGRWAIYRSKNYGIDWERVFLADPGVEIYDAVLIKYGWVIINTSDGFWETVKAGTSWTHLATLPPASRTAICNIGHGDILLCTDGRYIWRSTNLARSWTRVSDQRSIGRNFAGGSHFSGWSAGPFVPAITGCNSLVICSYGPFLSFSYDGGESFGSSIFWDDSYYGLRPTLPGAMPTEVSEPAHFVITQLLSDTNNSSHASDSEWVLVAKQLYGKNPMVMVYRGSIKVQYLFSWAYYTYIDFVPKFQQPVSASDSTQMVGCYNLPLSGEEGADKLLFSAQKKFVDGVEVVSLKYSSDGGVHWVDIDLAQTKVADENGLPLIGGGPYIDDSYANNTWIYGECDNAGVLRFEDGRRTQCISYELDLDMEGERTLTEEQQIDVIVLKIGEKEDSVDAIVAKDQEVEESVDACILGPNTKTYRIDRMIEDEVERQEDIDAIVAKDQEVEESLDAILQKNQRLIYKVGISVHDQNSKTYQVGVKVVRDGLIPRLSRIERLSPQMLDLYLPYVPYNPYDSAWEYI